MIVGKEGEAISQGSNWEKTPKRIGPRMGIEIHNLL